MVRVTSQSTAPRAHSTAPHEASQEHFDDQGRQTYAHCMPVGVQEADWWVQQREWGTGGNEGGERGKALSRGTVDSPLRIRPAATTVIGYQPKQPSAAGGSAYYAGKEEDYVIYILGVLKERGP